MKYPKLDDYFNFIFDDIRGLVYDDVEKPNYEADTEGIAKLGNIIQMIQNKDYYPNFYKKSAYLFIALSNGHNFRNGNKRIALFSYLYFHYLNEYKFRGISKKQYRQWFKDNFPHYKLSRAHFSSNIGWALYNFNKAVNISRDAHPEGHSYNFQDLKKIAEDFTRMTSRKG